MICPRTATFTSEGVALTYLTTEVDPTQDTATLTAYSIWPASFTLASLLLSAPALCTGHTVVELGAGISCLPSLAALAAGAACVLATDCEAAVLPHALSSLQAACARTASAAAHTALLHWQSPAHLAAVTAAHGANTFRLGLASDVLWLRSLAVTEPLAAQATALLACAQQLLVGWGGSSSSSSSSPPACTQSCGHLLLAFQRRSGDLLTALQLACASTGTQCAFLAPPAQPPQGEGSSAAAPVLLALLCPCQPCLQRALAASRRQQLLPTPTPSQLEREEEAYVQGVLAQRGRGAAGAQPATLHGNPLFTRSLLPRG